MAKIVSNAVVIEISRIAKDDQELASVVNAELLSALEEVIKHMVGDGAVIEINIAG